MTEVSHPHKLRKSFIITNLRTRGRRPKGIENRRAKRKSKPILEFMVNERIIKNYPSQATGILHTPAWKNRKWLAISSQIPTNSIIKKIDFHFVCRTVVL